MHDMMRDSDSKYARCTSTQIWYLRYLLRNKYLVVNQSALVSTEYIPLLTVILRLNKFVLQVYGFMYRMGHKFML